MGLCFSCGDTRKTHILSSSGNTHLKNIQKPHNDMVVYRIYPVDNPPLTPKKGTTVKLGI